MVLAAIGTACTASQRVATEKSGSTKSLTATDRLDWYQACWDHFNAHRWDDLKKCYADAATSQQFGYGKQNVSGPDNIVAGAEDFAKAFPDGHGHPQLILANGNNIASIYLLNGANTGTLRAPDGKEIPATKKKVGLLFGHVVEMDPKTLAVVKEFGVTDSATVAGQLGLSKHPVRPVMYQGEDMPNIVIAQNDETEMKNIEVEKMALQAWNRHDVVSGDMYMSDDFFSRQMYAPDDLLKGHAFERTKEFWDAFSDVRHYYSTIWAAGNYIVIVGTTEGVNNGDFPGFRRTGKKLVLPFMQIDRLEGGKIKETWFFNDAYVFGSQLGLSAN